MQAAGSRGNNGNSKRTNVYAPDCNVPSSSSTALPLPIALPLDDKRESQYSVRTTGRGTVELFTIASSSGSGTPPNPASARSELLLREKLFLTSWAKYRRFGRFPTGFSLNFALLVIITCQLWVYYNQDVRHASSVLNHFFRRLINVEGRFETRSLVLDTPEAIANHVNRTIFNGMTINEFSIRNYTIRRFWNARFSYRNGTISRRQLLRPLDPVSALPEIFDRAWLPRINDFELAIDYIDQFETSWWQWNLAQVCDGEGGGHFVCTLNYDITDWTPSSYFLWASHLAVFSLAILSILGILRKVKRTYVIYVTLEQQSETWNTLNAKEKLSIVNLWWFFTIVTNSIEVIVALQSTLMHENVIYRLTGTGVSIFLSYINIIQYFEHYGAFHVLFCTLARGVPEVAKVVVCVLPVLCAFAFLGVLVWWPTTWFATPSMAFCTLFSLLNGDVLHDNFINLRDVHPFFSQVYLYLFLCFFICVVLNVNITIIGEAFLKAQTYDGCSGIDMTQKRRHQSRDHRDTTPLALNWRSALSVFTNTKDRRGFSRCAPAVLRAIDEIDPIATSFTEFDGGEEGWPLEGASRNAPDGIRFQMGSKHVWSIRQRTAEQLLNKRYTLSDIAPLLTQLLEIEGRLSDPVQG